jgi:hypothetical protein
MYCRCHLNENQSRRHNPDENSKNPKNNPDNELRILERALRTDMNDVMAWQKLLSAAARSGSLVYVKKNQRAPRTVDLVNEKGLWARRDLREQYASERAWRRGKKRKPEFITLLNDVSDFRVVRDASRPSYDGTWSGFWGGVGVYEI